MAHDDLWWYRSCTISYRWVSTRKYVFLALTHRYMVHKTWSSCAVWHSAITCANVDLRSIRHHGNHLMVISQTMFQMSIIERCLKIKLIKLQPLQGLLHICISKLLVNAGLSLLWLLIWYSLIMKGVIYFSHALSLCTVIKPNTYTCTIFIINMLSYQQYYMMIYVQEAGIYM